MKLSIYFYIQELIYRVVYIFISFISCLVIMFFNIQSLLLIETYPFLKFSIKKFIVTNLTDLIDVIWLMCFSTSFLFIFPLVSYQVIQFFKPGWFIYQIFFIQILIYISSLSYVFILIFCYLDLLPTFIKFLIQWELKSLKEILKISIELRVFSYINWIMKLKYFFAFLSYCIILYLIQIQFLLQFNKIYKFIRLYKKQISFLLILLLFLMMPADIYLQFFLIILNFILIEFIFLFTCYKISNINYKCQQFINY